MGAAVFLAAAFTLRSGSHVRVSLLSNSVPARMVKAIDLAATLLAAALTVYLAYALLAFTWQAHVSGSTSPTIDEVPLVYSRGVMAIGALLLAVQMIARALQNLMSLPPEDAEARSIFGVE